MRYMISSVNFQGKRVSGLLFYFHMGGLPMFTRPPLLPFSLDITRVDSIDYTIIIILELDPPIVLQDIDSTLLIIFLGGGGLPIFLNLRT